MPRVHLVHWSADDARDHVRALRAAGFTVAGQRPFDGPGFAALKRRPPDAVVIDLDRRPGTGRDLALALRKTKATRAVPIVCAGGAKEAVEPLRALLPDAVFTRWSSVARAVERALAAAPSEPVVPASVFAGYAGTPLAKKLGVKPGSVLALVGAPLGFEDALDELPEGARVRRGARGRCDVLVWFVKTRAELERGVAKRLAPPADTGGLWIAWPKRSSPLASDLTQPVVREVAMDAGLVDYKVAKLDDTWSGLRFSLRDR